MAKIARELDALPDTVDFRDLMYVPTLVEVPPTLPLERWRACDVPMLDQGSEGACTGFGLATVANYLLFQLDGAPDKSPVSARMFYEIAKRYDEWPGESYDGSSARGAMKGWHKHGVCAETRWPYNPKKVDRELSHARALDAMNRPLGAYFRVNHRDLVAMHSAVTEVGVLFATATVHEGWEKVDRKTGAIPFRRRVLGGHAFAIVGYDADGFWIQNSWGRRWGFEGYGRISYDDWLQNGLDVWVARLGAPIRLNQANAAAAMRAAAPRAYEGYAFCELRPHIVSLGNDGLLRRSGTFANGPEELRDLIGTIRGQTESWARRRILLYAHGGLVEEESVVQRVANYRQPLLDAEVFPLAFVWRTDYWTTLENILEDALGRRRPEGFLDTAKDFLLERLDDTIEPIARAFSGKAAWDEMKENALAATSRSDGGARLALEQLMQLDDVEFHIVAHSAGSIFMAPLVQLLTAKGKIGAGPLKGAQGLGGRVKSCTLWAPACTVELFEKAYLPSLEAGTLENLTLFTLTDQAERDDDCAGIYHKSLLYLVSNAFEARARIARSKDRNEGVPLLGLARSVAASAELSALFKNGGATWIRTPNESRNKLQASTARRHGDFDDDAPTLMATFGRILATAGQQDVAAASKALVVRPLPQEVRNRRRRLDRTTLPTAGRR